VDVAKDRRRRTPALLLVDMINLFDFPDGAAMATAARRITPALVRLRARFDRAGAPVIHVNDNFAQWRGEFRDLVASCVEAGGIPAEIATRLAPQPQHYHVLKPKHSAFASSALPVLLAKLGVRRLVITGIAADSCVLATAQDANMAEYGTWVPSDCVASRQPQRKREALSLLSRSLNARTVASNRVHGLFPQ
jgi:Amidases related to nicotinamidase